MKVAIYISNYNTIGGVETFVNNFCKRMSKYFELTLMFDKVDSIDILLRAAEWCDVEQLDKSKHYTFDAFICASAWGYEPFKHITAKRIIQMVHADYTYYIKGWNFKYTKHPKVTHHVCVSQTVKETFEIATPNKCDAIIYNLLNPDVPNLPKLKNNKLHLVTVSRLSGEKGFDRMVKFAEKIPCDYEWNVWGNISGAYAQSIVFKFKHLPKVKFHGVTTEPYLEMAKADYLVQLSDSEGYCYSVIEALQVKTPCIITPFRSGNEQIKHKKNGYIVNFDLKSINFDEIINNIPIITPYKDISTEGDWLKILGYESTFKNIKEN
jgi:glycosyltransferase involved in cell wall biosynthesis